MHHRRLTRAQRNVQQPLPVQVRGVRARQACKDKPGGRYAGAAIRVGAAACARGAAFAVGCCPRPRGGVAGGPKYKGKGGREGDQEAGRHPPVRVAAAAADAAGPAGAAAQPPTAPAALRAFWAGVRELRGGRQPACNSMAANNQVHAAAGGTAGRGPPRRRSPARRQPGRPPVRGLPPPARRGSGGASVGRGGGRAPPWRRSLNERPGRPPAARLACHLLHRAGLGRAKARAARLAGGVPCSSLAGEFAEGLEARGALPSRRRRRRAGFSVQ